MALVILLIHSALSVFANKIGSFNLNYSVIRTHCIFLQYILKYSNIICRHAGFIDLQEDPAV